ncbi:hypothetical protein AB0J38_40580 [Streptomyces sp. NPDC050095]|uniref:hypothetical protein n=1 Tax=unclassified Streptomyces TaxID=2593676 RepID=UPI00342DA007
MDSHSAAEPTRCSSGFRDFRVTYHPASHAWPLQLAESAIVLAAAGAAVALAFLVLRRRTP